MTTTDDYMWTSAAELTTWLDTAHRDDEVQQRQTLRLMKIGEEFGEVIAAWIGYTGQNPRKGVTATLDDVEAELCDVIITAQVALLTLTGDTAQAANLLAGRLDTVLDRIA